MRKAELMAVPVVFLLLCAYLELLEYASDPRRYLATYSSVWKRLSSTEGAPSIRVC